MLSPLEIENQRQQEAATAKAKLKLAGENSVDVTAIDRATPDTLKAKGLSKLPQLIYIIGAQVNTIIQPSVNKLIDQYVKKFINDKVCLSTIEIIKLRTQRDLIVNQLNNIGNKIEILGKGITGLNTFLNTALTLITTVDITSIVASSALKIPPVNTLPVPGSITSLLNDAQTLIRKTTFDKLGSPKLLKLQITLAGAGLVLSIIGGYILIVSKAIAQIDYLLKTCDPNNPLPPLSPEIQLIANFQLQAEQTINETTYQGFIIEIETIPYTPTVNRRRAIGKNSQEIVLITTELSFTTDNLTLINELKLIIDRDNLKAY